MIKYNKKRIVIIALLVILIFLNIISIQSRYTCASDNLTQSNNSTRSNNKTYASTTAEISGTTVTEENTGNKLIKEADYNFFINSGKVDVETKYTLYQKNRLRITLDLPDDAYNIESFVDNFSSSVSFINKEQRIISVNRMLSNMKLSYASKSLLKNGLFITSIRIPYACNKLSVRVKLSPEYVLYSPIKHENFGSASIYPKPDRIESDGQALIFVWEYNNTAKDSSFPVVLLVKRRINIIYIVLSSLILLVAIVFFAKRKPAIKKVIVRKVDKISPHLKDDEEQILTILKQREGHCEQGTLRIITGMSKSNLSRIIKELEERKLIRKVKKGKKNIIFRI